MLKSGLSIACLLIMVSANALADDETSEQENAPVNQKSYVETVSGKKKDLYEKALVWFSKSLNDSNSSIELKDEKSANFIMKISACSELRVDGNPHVTFSLSYQAKDGKVRLAFEKVKNINYSGSNPFSALAYKEIPDEDEMEKLDRKCFKPLVARLVKNLKASPKSDDNW